VTSLLASMERKSLAGAQREWREKQPVNVPQNPLNPGDDFVRTGVAGFVEVDDTTANVTLDVALQRRSTARDRGKVAGADQ